MKKRRLPKHVWKRAMCVANGTYTPKVERKLRNSLKIQPELVNPFEIEEVYIPTKLKEVIEYELD